ncbi:hypothetical protein F2P81_009086 [Scophthalmus maximus]|uniref:Ras-related protein Rab-34-like n=1 Tax=Scophthalmus maximus TaxID=52904 RepID=A0A6A4T8W6_SCOMX|nr:hypothetical protein F2P81_009086 [Scophthalmus maximus]
MQCDLQKELLFISDVQTGQELSIFTVQSFNIAKVIVVGDVAVGKTCLISSFCKRDFEKNYKATIGVDFEMERFEVLGVPFSLQLHYRGVRLEQRELISTRQAPDQLAHIEQEAMRLSEEIKAEYWAVSAKSGDGIRDFFFRVASLTFEANVLSELEKQESRNFGDIIRITDSTEANHNPAKRKPNCC